MDKVRNRSIDILKGIGIVLVVLSHTKCPNGSWFASWFVQLFFIAAGYTYCQQYSDNQGVISFIFKRIKRLYIPWVIGGSIFTIANNILIKVNILTDNSLFLDAATGNSYGLDRVYSLTDILLMLKKIFLFQSAPKILGPVWFLSTLFFVEVIYAIIDYICAKVVKEHRAMIMNSIILLIYATGVYFSMNGIVDNSGYKLNIIALSIFLFHIGQKIKNYEAAYQKEQNPVLYIFLALSTIYIFRVLKVGGVRYVRGEIPGGVPLFVWSIAGWFLVYGISQVISEGKSFIADLFIYIGKHTLPIMMLHLFSFKIVTYIQVIIYKEPTYMLASFPVLYHENRWWFAYSIVGVCVPLILYAGSKKIMSQIRGKIKRQEEAHISL